MEQYLHHIWFDPLSASENFKLGLIEAAVILPLLVIGIPLWRWFWDKYNE